MAKLPALNPLIAAPAVCTTCGSYMLVDLERGPMNMVEKIIYRCANSESGCHYQVESDQRLNGMTVAIKKVEK